MKDNQLKIIKEWGSLKATEFPQEWTENDELTYRALFGEELTMLLCELEKILAAWEASELDEVY